MEEWVGIQWHRFITRAADGRDNPGAVRLEAVQRSIGLMFRAGGGAQAVRLAPANTTRVHNQRSLLQRIAGSATHAYLGQWQPDVLSLPPAISVFSDAQQNRALYLWLAALAAQTQASSDWLTSQMQATQAALQTFPGLTKNYHALRQAQLAQRPALARLKGRAAQAEHAVQCALRGEALPKDRPRDLHQADVAPVWLWLTQPPLAAEAARNIKDQDGQQNNTQNLSANDRRRRAAQAIKDERNEAPFIMMFRAESFMSWTEFTKVNRADDDDDDGNQLNAANNMDELAIAPDGQSSASRVKFDLDLPSAAHDDLPLGPGLKYPEWDYKRQALCPSTAACKSTPPAIPNPPPRPWPCAPPPGACAGAWRRCGPTQAACAGKPKATTSTWMPGFATRPTRARAAAPPPFFSGACAPSAAWPPCCWPTCRCPPMPT